MSRYDNLEDVMEVEDLSTRVLAAKRGWDKRGRGKKQHAKDGKAKKVGEPAVHFPHYRETPMGLKDEYNSLQGWQQAAQERGFAIKLKQVGKHLHQYVAVDSKGKQVGHFNHDQTPARRHQGRMY